MNYDRYLGLTIFERVVIHDELSDTIESSDPPPRQMAKAGSGGDGDDGED